MTLYFNVSLEKAFLLCVEGYLDNLFEVSFLRILGFLSFLDLYCYIPPGKGLRLSFFPHEHYIRNISKPLELGKYHKNVSVNIYTLA